MEWMAVLFATYMDHYRLALLQEFMRLDFFIVFFVKFWLTGLPGARLLSCLDLDVELR